MNLSIIGLGKLGSRMAAVMAHKGHHVIGVDLNSAFVDAIAIGWGARAAQSERAAASFEGRRQ